jgi:hypothetical protein
MGSFGNFVSFMETKLRSVLSEQHLSRSNDSKTDWRLESRPNPQTGMSAPRLRAAFALLWRGEARNAENRSEAVIQIISKKNILF